jgi:phosphoribosylanthranilate isomerase
VVDFSAPSFVKICGVTRIDDVEVTISAGADALGLILASSPRQISLEMATNLALAAKNRIDVVAVFRDQADQWILDAIDEVGPDVVQLHGSLSDGLFDGIRQRDVQLVKALVIGSDEFTNFDDRRVDAVLIDGSRPGSGVAHSWEALVRRTFCVPVIAAGGLNPDHVASEIALSMAWGVDTASGVEAAPGAKDPTLVRRFVENARRAFVDREEK